MFDGKSTYDKPGRDIAEVFSEYQRGDAETLLCVTYGHTGVTAAASCRYVKAVALVGLCVMTGGYCSARSDEHH